MKSYINRTFRPLIATARRSTMAVAMTMAAALCFGPTSVSAGELTIYSTTDGDNLKVIKEAFTKAHPDITVH
jgi:ABC-type glycerol-3-phosphate transport system substrate-binding protein